MPRTPPASQVDLVVFGATAGGVVAATAAARHGLRVALVEPSRHVGGMLSGGLAKSDVERQEPLIGGLAHDLFDQIGRRYGSGPAWRFEPKVAEAVLREWIDDAGVGLDLGWGLARVDTSGGRIRAVVSDSGERLEAGWFVDASYEGDLLAGAGVSFAVGREGRDRYGESLAGRLEMLPNPHQFTVPVPATSPAGELLPGIQPYDEVGPLGAGDGKLQSYCYRVCLTGDPANQVPIPEPAGYDPERYLLVRRYLTALGDSADLGQFMGLGQLPGRKLDVNSGGPVSTNLLGASWDYPLAGPERRQRIADDHRSWAQGLLYYLGYDTAVPQRVRGQMARLGLPADEFPSTGHWPPQLYVRDARRMLGDVLLTQEDVLGGASGVPDAVGMCGYNIDIREVQWVAAPVSRFPEVSLEVLTEGYLSVPVEPYPLPYRALLPRREECDNLLVSTCISASHVAFAAFRMEPGFMIAGHAAGVAAALAADTGHAPHDVPVDRLQALLEAEGQVLRPPPQSG